ncbi:glycosyltransferase [candidate division KSB1 bacterium]|nr:glycosyltransferase [candidate division KSB1 bacterium]
MRIILISYHGLADYTIALANALAQNNEVMLVLSQKSATPFLHRIDQSIRRKLVYFPRLRNPLNLLYTLKIFFAIRRFKPDVIHFQGGFIWFSFILPLLLKYPVITTIHDAEPHAGDESSRNMRWFLPNFLATRFSSKLIVHGENIRQQLARNSKIPVNKIASIQHGNGFIHKRNSKQIKCEDYRILFFGRILEYKGLPYLIKAEPLISSEIPELKICIAGDGALMQDYEKLISDRSRYEIYNEYIDQELMEKLFLSSSLVVLPYNEASQSGIISIAYAFAKPVIATQVGALPELIEHQRTGWIVPPCDERKLAQGIITLLKDKKLREKLGRNAFEKARNEMSWTNIARQTCDVYFSILNKRSKTNNDERQGNPDC